MTALLFILTGAAVLILVALAVYQQENANDLNIKGLDAEPNVRRTTD